MPRDTSNRASRHADAIEMGRRLFFDTRMSPNGYVACVRCHQPDRAWTDGTARAQGLGPLDRNSPTLANLSLLRWYGWDGASDSLWLASLRPILDAREIASTPERVAAVVRGDRDMACRYKRAFGARAAAEDEVTVLVNTAKALAAFAETLTTGRTPFDEFRDALARGDAAAANRYPAAAQRGLKIFVGKGNCFFCHSGPNFSNGEFHDTGVPFFVAPGQADGGRYAGIRKLQASYFNRLGRYNDDRTHSNATATRHATADHRHWGAFKTPSLRNVAVTAPYMHNGSLATLRDVVRHYSELNEDRLHADGERILRPLHLSDEESDDLIAFLQTLTDAQGERRSVPASAAGPCR
jgi:cytochrome c peroxidase